MNASTLVRKLWTNAILRVQRSEAMKYLALTLLLLPTGCTILTVTDAGVSAVTTVVKVGAKAVGAAVDAVVPDKDKDKK
jgi:hypothetical protein